MFIARKSHCENYDSPHSTAGSRAVSRALYSDRSRLDITLDDGIRSFINVLRLQAPKSDSKITKNTQNTPWPFLASPDHANALSRIQRLPEETSPNVECSGHSPKIREQVKKALPSKHEPGENSFRFLELGRGKYRVVTNATSRRKQYLTHQGDNPDCSHMKANARSSRL
jgi:hypothetical protein